MFTIRPGRQRLAAMLAVSVLLFAWSDLPAQTRPKRLDVGGEPASAFLWVGNSFFYRTYLNIRHVCDGGDVGCSSRRRARSNMSIFRGLPTKKCAQSAPSLRVAARTVGCCVALLDHIDIWPSSGVLHPARPGHNASRA